MLNPVYPLIGLGNLPMNLSNIFMKFDADSGNLLADVSNVLLQLAADRFNLFLQSSLCQDQIVLGNDNLFFQFRLCQDQIVLGGDNLFFEFRLCQGQIVLGSDNPFFQFRLYQSQIILGGDVLNQMLVNGDRHPFRSALIHPEFVLQTAGGGQGIGRDADHDGFRVLGFGIVENGARVVAFPDSCQGWRP